MNVLDQIIPYLLNPYTGTILFVIAIGYVVRATTVSNKWIPAIGMVFGSLFFICVAPLTIKTDANHAWNWYVLLWGVGLILSAFAWVIHLLVISRLEEWARTKIPALDKWLDKTSDVNTQPPKDNP